MADTNGAPLTGDTVAELPPTNVRSVILPQVSPAGALEGPNDARAFQVFDYILMGVVLAASLVAMFVPGIIAMPVQRVVLMFLMALMGALLMGRQVQANFRYAKGPMVLAITGIWVVIFSAMLLFNHLMKPDFKVSILNFTHQGTDVYLEDPDVVQVRRVSNSGGIPDIFRENNQLVLNFPEQVYGTIVRIRVPSGQLYEGEVNYKEGQKSAVELTTDFTLISPQ